MKIDYKQAMFLMVVFLITLIVYEKLVSPMLEKTNA
jgi:hypothetical protein